MSSPRHVLEASAAPHQSGDGGVLAVVVDTEGSTYVRPGAMALFASAGGQVGWLSGGCLEPEIESRAQLAATDRRIASMDIDTRDDEDLMSGSAPGCRGRLRLALLPLAAMPGWPEVVDAWRQRQGALQLWLSTHAGLQAQVGRVHRQWQIDASMTLPWRISVEAPPALLVFGAGPETPTLLPLLRSLGWMVTLVERRARWIPHAAHADHSLASSPEAVLHKLEGTAFDAALVMNHNFELDRETLHALAGNQVAFIGLLGPVRRREDLFRVLPAHTRESLVERLRSPVGMALGGQGPEAIALSIAAQLQGYRFPQ
ncbi:MAG: XdhC family protein [Pseudoxanthomonas sp.]